MATLKKIHQRFIVERLACFDEPSDVAAAVKEEFGIEVTRQQVWNYDASKPHVRTRLAKSLAKLFYATRERFRAETEDIAIANKAYRLNLLNKMVSEAVRRKNFPLASNLLEQAAKEVGGAYTNERKHSGSLLNIDVSSLTDEQLERIAGGEEPAHVLGRTRSG